MTSKPNGILHWSIEEISKALKIDIKDVKEYFTDGRRVSFLVERRIAKEFLNGTLPKSEGSAFDIIDSRGKKWEVRSISDKVYFSPSNQVGSGRHFDENGFLKKLNEVDGFILADIKSFPDIPFWIIPVDLVKSWWEEGKLGKNAMVSRNKILNLIKNYKKPK